MGMQRMDFETLVQTRKSVRGFKREPVARAVIEDIIEVAKRAPSSMNTQPWHIHVLTGEPLEEVRRRNMEEMMAGAKEQRAFLGAHQHLLHVAPAQLLEGLAAARMCQGWVFIDDGARLATSIMSSMRARATGSLFEPAWAAGLSQRLEIHQYLFSVPV